MNKCHPGSISPNELMLPMYNKSKWINATHVKSVQMNKWNPCTINPNE